MPMVKMIEYDNAPPEVKAVYDDIMATRNSNRLANGYQVPVDEQFKFVS